MTTRDAGAQGNPPAIEAPTGTTFGITSAELYAVVTF